MHIHDEAPPLNPWPFLAGDALLVATAILISSQAQAPLNGLPLIAITVCVCLGAVVAVIPFVLNHTRKQDLALADRQREISALAQTTASSAEQISIAAASLHTLADHTARALKLGEALPHKLQEKINEFKTQLNEVAVTENEALSQEVNTLRTSETERLETALTGVRKIALELSNLEATTQKHLKELNASLARFTADAGKSADSAAKSIESARHAAEKSLSTAHTAALDALQESVASAIARLDQKFSSFADKLSEQIASAKIETPAAKPATTQAAETPSVIAAKPVTSTSSRPPTQAATTPPFEIPAPAPSVEPDTNISPSDSPNTSAEISAESADSPPSPSKFPIAKTGSAPAEKPATRPPLATKSFSETSPHRAPNSTPETSALLEPAAEDVPTALLTEEKPIRKRASRKPVVTDNELTLGIELEPASDFSQLAPDEAIPAVSADGLTRLIVTAYIGIGNKLYVRGEGPGLAWDRGVPLQFVSIGKWRWESADATGPVQLKLYKNDTQECSNVGTLSIAPGHQHEVMASFN
ncbi:MAG: hypothetical protein QM715_12310 [Nibricoccus sp.]